MNNSNRKNIRFEGDTNGIDMKYWEIRTCPICNTKFYARKKYNKITCSEKCYNEYIKIHKDEINKKRSKTLKEINKNKSIEEKREELKKAKETCMKRYGVDMFQKTDEYRKKLSERFKNKDWSDRSKKINEKIKVKYDEICKNDNLTLMNFNGRFNCTVKCNNCGNVFDIHVLGYLTDKTTKNLCRHCHPNINSTSETKPIKFIENILNKYKIEYIKNDRLLIKPYEIDIYIPSLKIGFELNGNYWHSEFSCNKNKDYHINKTKLAYENNIKLIQIFEDEILNKPNIVESRVKNLLGLTSNRIYARNCVIHELDFKTKKEFLQENHIDGDSVSSINYGLYHDNILVSVATFGKRKISGKIQYELIRFANCLNTNVIGGFSKLLKYFMKNNESKYLVTYADIRWSGMDYMKTVYFKNNFKFISYTKPNYYYEDKKNYLIRINRLNFTKQKLIKMGYDKNKTEIQIMIENGYDRIWDCGSMKFEYTNI